MHELATAHATLTPRAADEARAGTCCSAARCCSLLLAACCCYCCYCCSGCYCCSCCVSLSALSLRAPLTASPSLTHTLALPPTPACPVRIDAPGLETATPLRAAHPACFILSAAAGDRRGVSAGQLSAGCRAAPREQGRKGVLATHGIRLPPAAAFPAASGASCELLPRSSGVQRPVSCVLRPSKRPASTAAPAAGRALPSFPLALK